MSLPAATAQLLTAVQDGDVGQVKALLADDPSLADARDGSGVSAVMLACYRGQWEVAEVLAAARPSLDVFEAAALGRVDQLDAIVAADPEAVAGRSPDGFTALHLAAFLGQEEAVRRLLAAGADVNAVSRNVMSVTALHSAAAGGHRRVIELLLEAGADPNALQHGGWTALHAAAHHGDDELVSLLLAAGADRSIADREGRTPADMAREYHHRELAERLSAEG